MSVRIPLVLWHKVSLLKTVSSDMKVGSSMAPSTHSNSKAMFCVADQKRDLHGEFSPDPINLLLFANSHYNSVFVVDVVGHLRLADGHPLHPRPVLCIKILQISEGGFGSVYKAIINDPTATGEDSHSVPLAVAVKRFKR
ncbi:hypothetical protein YC2023_007444 [Brassica napus]